MTLRELRQRAGLSQTALAGAAHVNVLTLSLIEQRRLKPSANQIARIVAVLGVAPREVDDFGDYDLVSPTITPTEERM